MAFGTVLMALGSGSSSVAFELDSLAEQSVIEILTHDEGGALRDTKVWVTVVAGAGYIRTNDSRWLANIRRGSDVALRVRGVERPFRAEESDDAELYGRVEEAFLEKYGWLQRLMSTFRWSRPTVLRMTPI